MLSQLIYALLWLLNKLLEFLAEMWCHRLLAEVQTEHQSGEGISVILNVVLLLMPAGSVQIFQKELIYRDYHVQLALGFTKNCLKGRKKNLVSSNCVDEKASLMSEARRQYANRFQIKKKQSFRLPLNKTNIFRILSLTRWATDVEDCTGCHLCLTKTGNWGCSFHVLTRFWL